MLAGKGSCCYDRDRSAVLLPGRFMTQAGKGGYDEKNRIYWPWPYGSSDGP